MKKWTIFLALLAATMLAGCSGAVRYQVMGADAAPGADAHLVVTPKDGNQEVVLTVENLLPPARAKKGSSSYAVWVRHADRAPQQLGNLTYDADKRTGELTASTPYKDFLLSVHPEKTENPNAPGQVIVLQQKVRLD